MGVLWQSSEPSRSQKVFEQTQDLHVAIYLFALESIADVHIMASNFSITPEKQANILRFSSQQYWTTPAEVKNVDLSGKVAIVTGANSGVGFATSLQLLDLGLSKLILAVRDEKKGSVARQKLIAQTSQGAGRYTIEVWHLDLSVYNSVVAFADCARSLERLDYVDLNAAIAPAHQVFNKSTGHDELIQVNYISTARLAILLLPVIKEKRASGAQPVPSRITFTSSEIAAWTKFKERDQEPLLAWFDKEVPQTMWHFPTMMDRLAVSKLLGQFFLSELAKRVQPSVAVINAASPATCSDAELTNEHDKQLLGKIIRFMKNLTANPCSVGSRMMVDALVNHGEETHGQFLSFQQIVP